MGATNRTQNYNLPQFVGNDKPTWLGDVNGAMNLIDAQMKTNNDLANLAKTTADTAQTTANSAETIASSAQTTAEGAETTSNNALSKALEVEGALSNLLQLVFPIGATYVTQNSNDNPNSILGFGTWERLQARLPIGIDDNDANYQTVGTVGGTKTNTLSFWNMPAGVVWNQTGTISVGSGNLTLSAKTDIATAINNMPPYKVVGYMWLRTA